MAKKEKMCDGQEFKPIIHRTRLKDFQVWGGRALFPKDTEFKEREPRQFVECVKCGRRLQTKMAWQECESAFLQTLPPHKRKGWWKKGVKLDNRGRKAWRR